MGLDWLGKVGRRKAVGVRKGGVQLARHLRAINLVPIGVGATIGAGVYVLVGTVAREKVGPALPLSFLIAGIAAALSALCYAELASRCPSAGSAYHYAYTCVGEGVAWIIGWALILEYTVGGSTVARGISPNLALFFGGADKAPAWITRRVMFGYEVDPCAAVLVLLVTALLCADIRESAAFQAFMTIANVVVLLFVIVAGGYIGFTHGWPGYHMESGYLPFGFNGILSGAATLFFAYIGFDTVASTAEEVVNPQVDLPWGIALALCICSTLYMLVSVVIVGIVPYNIMDPNTPMSSAFSEYGLHWATYIVTAGAVAALATTLLGSLLPQPRILMAMARDGLLPKFFSRINRSTKVPINGTLVTGLAASIMSFTLDLDQLAGMVSVGTLLAFTIVAVSILILRYAPPLEPPVGLVTPQESSNLQQPQPGPSQAIPAPPRTFVSLFSRRTYLTPVLSLLSESSVNSLPNFLQNYDSDSSSDKEDERVEHAQSTIRDPAQEQLLPTSTSPDPQPSVPEMNREEARRLAAGIGIGFVIIGVILLSIAVSFSFFKYLRYGMGGIGGIGILGGLTILGLIDQDEARHKFGDAGGFQCPWVPVLPVSSVLINVYLLVNLGLGTWLRVGVWLLLGVLLYLTYGIKQSALAKDQAKEIRRQRGASSLAHV